MLGGVKELAKQPVRANRDVAHRWIVGSDGVTHVVVRRKTDSEKIGTRVMAEVLAFNGALSKLLDHFVAPRRGFERAAETSLGA